MKKSEHTPTMLKKLRIKFVILNMTTVTIALVAIFTAICVIDYNQRVNSVYEALNATIGRASDESKLSFFNDSAHPINKTGDNPKNNGTPPEIGGNKHDKNVPTPVAIYSIKADGTLVPVSSMTTASISDDVLDRATEALASHANGNGYLDSIGLFYSKQTIAETTYVAFADVSTASSWQTLALTLVGVGMGALAVFLVISIFFSRWALRPVEAAWNQQQQFIADASHELKTPLTVILANTSILHKHPERSIASQSQWVESTQTEAERMQELICDMLDLARPNNQRTHEEQVMCVDLTDLVEGDLLQFESVAFERNITLASNIDHNVQVMGNETRLHRLVSTLIDNACKYAEENSTVTVKLRQTVRHVEFSVHNTGAVIAPEDLPHVFDRFFRADRARTYSAGSYGLGLAIAREVAEEHGGTLSVSSTEIEGTTFTATLKLPPTTAS